MSLDYSLILALIAGIGLVLITGPIGCFILWQRMAYFCESLTHSALLGIAFGLLLQTDINLGMLGSCIVFALILSILREKHILVNDTLLGVLAHAFLAIGIVALNILGQHHIDLHDILIGNIFAITLKDIYFIYAIAVVGLIYILKMWKQLVLITINPDLAKVDQIKVGSINFGFVIIVSLTVAISVQAVGVLLITSLLIIPSATAKLIAHTPQQMAFKAVVFSLTAMLLGVFTAYGVKLPAGPTVVSVAAAIFLTMLIYSLVKKKKYK